MMGLVGASKEGEEGKGEGGDVTSKVITFGGPVIIWPEPPPPPM